MGAAGSVRRAAKEEMNQLHEKALNREEEIEGEEGEQWARSEARLHRLLSEKHQLAEELRQTRQSLRVQSDGWRRERSKATALMFSELPLNMIQTQSTESTDGPGGGDTPLTKTFPMVTLAQCDVAGFSSLASRLQPHEVVRIIDHFHTLVDQAFSHPDIFLMERTSSGCVAACGLMETFPERPRSGTESQLSMTDSSYGSVPDLNEDKTETFRRHFTPSQPIHQPPNIDSQTSPAYPDSQRSPQYFASLLATAALQLMSNSTQIEIPNSEENRQLQLRIALHAGPCSAGVIGLQTSGGSDGSRIPHYKLFGLSLGHTRNLCLTGLALQIRVSKPCQELLASAGQFHFERCPDYTMWSARRPIESYWLVGREGMELTLPSLELALPLTEYDDSHI